MWAIYRKIQSPTKTIIVHRRVGRKKIETYWGFKYWGALCNSNRDHVNVTTKWEEVTCLRCLKKGELYYGYTRSKDILA